MKFPARLALALTALFSTSAVALDGAPLDRSTLVQTFGDEFNRFSWYAEGDVKMKGGGTWRTNFGYTWVPVNDEKNHTLIWNKEQQIYVDPGFTGTNSKALGLTAFSVKNGILTITANRTANPFLYGYKYTSGLITTEPTFTQTYGVFEIRAKFPKGKGFWPAFWLLPVDKSWPPEIDILEILGHEPTKYYTTIHSNETGVHTKSDIPVHIIPDSSAGFHNYAVEWGPQEIVFYFDDKEVGRRPTPSDLNKPCYLLLNLALGGDWAGSPDVTTRFPGVMQVDYIRAYQRKSLAAAPAQTSAPNPPSKTVTSNATSTSTKTIVKTNAPSISKVIAPAAQRPKP